MQVIKYPERKDWNELLERPYQDNSEVLQSVQHILDEVKLNGDDAIKKFTKKFDGIDLQNLHVEFEEIENSKSKVSEDLKNAIKKAKDNIEKFHESQIVKPAIIETMPGIDCWRKNVGIEKIGLYIPGGTAPLFSSVLMLGVPAMLAGCKEIILCTPC